jgi:hypothetical protein
MQSGGFSSTATSELAGRAAAEAAVVEVGITASEGGAGVGDGVDAVGAGVTEKETKTGAA